MTDYKVISADNKQQFKANMADAVNDGYEPYGELKILQPTGNFQGFFQAVVKSAPKGDSK